MKIILESNGPRDSVCRFHDSVWGGGIAGAAKNQSSVWGLACWNPYSKARKKWFFSSFFMVVIALICLLSSGLSVGLGK